jgi:predicted nucleic acid-binding protein
MKALLDTSALNWFVDNTDAAAVLLDARTRGLVEVLVPPETASEARNTKNENRRAHLESFLANFFPLAPTRVPRLGAFRLGLARIDNAADFARLDQLGFLKGGQDRNIAANAGGYRCDVFLTRDREMSVAKRAQLEVTLGGTRVLEPAAFVAELQRLLEET